MFDCDNITLFNSYVDDARRTKYTTTYIRGVDWQSKDSMSVNQIRGIMSADEINIFIPYEANQGGKKYIPPRAFLKLSESDRCKYFTFKQNDKIVKGIIDFNMDDPNSMKHLETMYDDVVNVKTIVTCDMMGHFEIGCE